MEAWLDKVMVEHTCPDCNGARVRATRLLFTVGGKTIHDVGQLNFDELHAFLGTIKPTGRGADAGRQVLKEIRGRLELLLGIGLDYLNFNRRSGTLSGGESQRIRLSTQIGSGLMGMLYVLDEPSIGLHPKDNVKMIATLESLRDIGNTVIVVEHDEDTIRAADHVVEMGPGPGVHGGRVVVQGSLSDVLNSKASPTGQFLSGRRWIQTPAARRAGNGQTLTIRGARENNLKSVDVSFPLGSLVAITGASGSGKSTLVNEILFKALWKRLVDTRTLPGEHDAIEGAEHVHKVVNIDQSPIGRNSRSNPATYVGFYDDIRDLFTAAPVSVERGYKPGRFSFNVKGGRCEECQGEGTITTQLYFMPDVEVTCGACKGARFNSDTLEVTLRGKTIDDVLNMSIEEGVIFFSAEPRGEEASRRAQRAWPRLPDSRPVGDHAVGRRSAADQDRHRTEQAPAIEAHRVHPRRTDHRPSPGRHRTAAGIAQPARRRGPHGPAHRTSRGRDQDRRSRDRPRSRRRPRRRPRGGDRDARGRRRVHGVAHRPLPEGAPELVRSRSRSRLTRSFLEPEDRLMHRARVVAGVCSSVSAAGVSRSGLPPNHTPSFSSPMSPSRCGTA